MKKAVIVAKETVEFQEFALPEISANEVLVKVKAVGLCTFEQRYYTGMKEDYPFNGGHEVCGIVEQVGSEVGSGIKPGDKVVVGKFAGSEIKLDGEDYKFVKQDDILAVVID